MSGSVVVVTGANGLVGARTCAALASRGASVRAVVRREGVAPVLDGVVEHVGDYGDTGFAASVLAGADAAITTVHPMASGLEQQRAAVDDTVAFVRAAAEAGVARHAHVSTGAVYDRAPEAGDVDEDSPLVDGDDAGPYPITKRDLDLALAGLDGITRVLVRPPAILGPAESSVWNTLRPNAIKQYEGARHAVAEQTFPWVHVDDLAAVLADLALGVIAGPADGTCAAVNVAGEPATLRQYIETVTTAVGVDPIWDDAPAWTGRYVTDRARSWGWAPRVSLQDALRELAAGLRA